MLVYNVKYYISDDETCHKSGYWAVLLEKLGGRMKLQKSGRNIIIFLLVGILCLYVWDIGGSDMFPWTKTYFTSYSNYIRFLREHSFYAAEYFSEYIPETSSSVEYFCYQNFKEKNVAHTIVLQEEEYKSILEKKKDLYIEYSNSLASEIIYVLEDEICWNIENIKEKNIDVDFLGKVMHLKQQQNYYCLIVFKTNTIHGTCYTGIIANDSTYEIIEFSVEIPKEY